MNAKRVLVAAVLVGMASVSLLARADDPHVGTWKLNAEKSKNSVYKSGIVTIEQAGDALKATVDLVATDGRSVKWGFTAAADGKYHPVEGGTPLGDSFAMTRLDTRTTRLTWRQGGKDTATQIVVVADDGKTRTITTKGTNAAGQPVDSMTFYDKQ
jgi:hypothetical protein